MKIFTERDKFEMFTAADFRWWDETHFVTLGITPSLTAEAYSDWLDGVIDKITKSK